MLKMQFLSFFKAPSIGVKLILEIVLIMLGFKLFVIYLTKFI